MEAQEQSGGQRKQKRNARMLGKLVVVAVLMFGFGYSLVPLYKKICEITGINVLAVQETVDVKPANTQVDTSRLVTVEPPLAMLTQDPAVQRQMVLHGAGVAQVGEAVMQMDQATQQNAALVEQGTAAAQSLKDQAGQLATLVDRKSVV